MIVLSLCVARNLWRGCCGKVILCNDDDAAAPLDKQCGVHTFFEVAGHITHFAVRAARNPLFEAFAHVGAHRFGFRNAAGRKSKLLGAPLYKHREFLLLRHSNTLKLYPCCSSQSMERGSAYLRFVYERNESWNVIIEPFLT